MIKLSESKRKIPERSCVGCGNSFPKSVLIRVVRPKDGDVCLDMTGKISGRGAYICNNIECLKKARKAKRLERNLDVSISDDVYHSLEATLTDDAGK